MHKVWLKTLCKITSKQNCGARQPKARREKTSAVHTEVFRFCLFTPLSWTSKAIQLAHIYIPHNGATVRSGIVSSYFWSYIGTLRPTLLTSPSLSGFALSPVSEIIISCGNGFVKPFFKSFSTFFELCNLLGVHKGCSIKLDLDFLAVKVYITLYPKRNCILFPNLSEKLGN